MSKNLSFKKIQASYCTQTDVITSNRYKFQLYVGLVGGYSDHDRFMGINVTSVIA